MEKAEYDVLTRDQAHPDDPPRRFMMKANGGYGPLMEAPAEDAETHGPTVAFDWHDQSLRVLVYGQDTDEPLTIVFNDDGTISEIRDAEDRVLR